jgi:hypothetical protein
MLEGNFHRDEDGNLVRPGETMDVPSVHGRELVEAGFVELLERRWVRAREQ